MTRSVLTRSLSIGAVAAILAVSTASAAGPFQFYSVTPCRIADTRVGSGFTGLSGPPGLTSGAVRSFPVAGLCGLPSGPNAPSAVVLNVTVVGPTQQGFLKIWPYNTAQPGVSTINFAANEPAIANGAIVPLTSDPTLQISIVYGTASPGGSANVVLDVTGYFK